MSQAFVAVATEMGAPMSRVETWVSQQRVSLNLNVEVTVGPSEAVKDEAVNVDREETDAQENALPAGAPSRLVLHSQFPSQHLSDDREVIVYLPPGYDKQERRYPVMYMHDGQNLFDPETSFVRGRTWEIRQTADRLIAANAIEPPIVVGVYNTPRRLQEYTHARDRRMGGGGAPKYGLFLVEELKPWIDEQYRTLPGETDTGIGGSSLGGLVTIFLGLEHAETFGKLAVMSPSVWWNHKSILGYVNEYDGPPWPRIWLDIGDGEGRRVQDDVALLNQRLIAGGWKPEVNLHYQIAKGGTHDESAWAARVGEMLKFLFPAKQ